MMRRYPQLYPSGEVVPGGLQLSTGQEVLRLQRSQHSPTDFLLRQFEYMVEVSIPEFLGTKTQVLADGTVVELVDYELKRPTYGSAREFGEALPLVPYKATSEMLDYTGIVWVTIRKTKEGRVSEERVSFGRLFVMVGSKYCHTYGMSDSEKRKYGFDPRDKGGYFIVEGVPKFLNSFDNKANNKILYQLNSPYTAQCARLLSGLPSGITRESVVGVVWRKEAEHDLKEAPLLPALVFVIPTYQFKSSEKTYQLKSSEKTIGDDSDTGASKSVPISIFTVARLIDANIDFEKEVLRFIPKEYTTGVRTQLLNHRGRLTDKKEIEIAMKEIGQGKSINDSTIVERYKVTIAEEVFPSLPAKRKIKMIAYMAAQLLLRITYPKTYHYDDLDEFSNKYIKTMVRFMLSIFIGNRKQGEDKFGFEFTPHALEHLGTEIATAHKASLKGVSYKTTNNKQIAVQTFLNTDPSLWYTDLRVIASPAPKEDSKIDSRKIAKDSQLFICPYDTPESKMVGLKRSLAMVASVSVGYDHYIDKHLEYLEKSKLIGEKMNTPMGRVDSLFVNGVYHSYCNTEKVVDYFRTQRRTNVLSEVSVVVYKQGVKRTGSKDEVVTTLFIKTDAGRLITPLLTVEKGELVLVKKIDDLRDRDANTTFEKLQEVGAVEFLDIDEVVAHSVVCPAPELLHKYPNATHCQYVQYTFVSTTVADITMILKSMVDRVAGQVSKEKQRIGIPHIAALTPSQHPGTPAQELYTPQLPIATTSYSAVSGEYKAFGQMMTIAFTSHPDTIDDAVVVNRAFVERGGLRTGRIITVTASYTTHYDSSSKTGKMLYRPIDKSGEHLLASGLPPRNYIIMKNQILIGIRGSDGSDQSIIYKDSKVARVLGVSKFEKDGNYYVRVKLVKVGAAGQGDKLVKLWGQKFTIAKFVDDVDMSYDEITGNSVDILVNVLSVIKRGTLPWLIDLIANQMAATTGKFVSLDDGDLSIDDLYRFMLNNGFKTTGQTLISGITGETIDCDVFSGLTFMEVNIHRAEEKAFMGGGKQDPVTFNPAKGKDKVGGGHTKNPEQKKFAGSTVGAEFINTQSSGDIITTLKCTDCGYNRAQYDPFSDTYYCPHCGNDNFVEVNESGSVNYAETMSAALGFGMRTITRGNMEIPTILHSDIDIIREKKKTLTLSVKEK